MHSKNYKMPVKYSKQMKQHVNTVKKKITGPKWSHSHQGPMAVNQDLIANLTIVSASPGMKLLNSQSGNS